MPITIQQNVINVKNANEDTYHAASGYIVGNIADINNATASVISDINTAKSRAESALATILGDEAGPSEIKDMFAGTFSDSISYTAGQYVIQPGNESTPINHLYKFITNHAAGAWSGSDVIEVKLANEMANLKSAIEQTTICKNLIGNEANRLYPVFIPAHSTLTVTKKDGSVFPSDSTRKLTVYNKNKEKLVDITLKNGAATRNYTLNVSLGNVYYISQNKTDGGPIQVEIGSEATDFVDYFENASALNSGLYATIGLNGNQYLLYNYATKVITFPTGYIYRHGRGWSNSSQQTINLSNILSGEAASLAANLFVSSDGTIYGKAWNSFPDLPDPFLGFVYGTYVNINGLTKDRIKVIDQYGERLDIANSQSGAFVGITATGNVVYTPSDRTLTIPQGFYVFHGIGAWTPQGGYSLDWHTVINSAQVIFFMKRDGTIYATDWHENEPHTYDDEPIGYAYGDNIYINGIPQERISIVSEPDKKQVYCFGDSITAGTGTTKAYHMYFHDWKPDYHFKNYGIGSTGYSTPSNQEVVAGGGVEGIGLRTQQNGYNRILQVMQTIQDKMPIITISAGTNDYNTGKDLADFRTAVQNTLDYALSKTPYVFVMTPIKRLKSPKNTSGDWDEPNKVNLYLKDYSDVIIEECKARGITYCDGYDVSLDPKNSTSNETFYYDGLHPNAAGHARMARNYWNKFLECICQ